MKHRIAEKKNYHKKFFKFVFFLIPFLLTALIFFSVKWDVKKPNGYTNVYIPPGKNSGQIAVILKNKEIIENVTFFKIYVSYLGVSDKLVAGEYRLRKYSSIRSVIDLLSKGPIAQSVWITLPEGITANKIGEKIDKKGEIKSKEFIELVNRPSDFDYLFLAKGLTSLEGYLFPNTYRVFSSTKTEQFIKMLLSEFERKITMLDWKYAQSKNLTKHQIVTIASLIEREAKIPAERPLVAAVIYNRMSRNMKLEIDATVQYSLPRWKKSLNYSDLKVDSPYNTYKIKGLPPGPICNPGIDSIKAALNPAKVDYLYYVLADSSGRHAFATSYNEFLRLKRLKP